MTTPVFKWLDNEYSAEKVVTLAGAAPKVYDDSLELFTEQHPVLEGEVSYQGPAVVLKYQNKAVVFLGTFDPKKPFRLISSVMLKKARVVDESQYIKVERTEPASSYQRRGPYRKAYTNRTTGHDFSRKPWRPQRDR